MMRPTTLCLSLVLTLGSAHAQSRPSAPDTLRKLTAGVKTGAAVLVSRFPLREKIRALKVIAAGVRDRRQHLVAVTGGGGFATWEEAQSTTGPTATSASNGSSRLVTVSKNQLRFEEESVANRVQTSGPDGFVRGIWTLNLAKGSHRTLLRRNGLGNTEVRTHAVSDTGGWDGQEHYRRGFFGRRTALEPFSSIWE